MVILIGELYHVILYDKSTYNHSHMQINICEIIIKLLIQ